MKFKWPGLENTYNCPGQQPFTLNRLHPFFSCTYLLHSALPSTQPGESLGADLLRAPAEAGVSEQK